MVFQTLALYPHMTVRENLEFGLKLGGRCPAGEIRERVRETAEILDLQPILTANPSIFPGSAPARRPRTRHGAQTEDFPFLTNRFRT